jgi:hypothetical protein
MQFCKRRHGTVTRAKQGMTAEPAITGFTTVAAFYDVTVRVTGDAIHIEAGEWYTFRVMPGEAAVLCFNRFISHTSMIQQLCSLKYVQHVGLQDKKFRSCCYMWMDFPDSFRDVLETSIESTYGGDITTTFTFSATRSRALAWVLNDNVYRSIGREQKKMKYMGNLATLARYMRLWRKRNKKLGSDLTLGKIKFREWGRVTTWVKAHMGIDSTQWERYKLTGPPTPLLIAPEVDDDEADDASGTTVTDSDA